MAENKELSQLELFEQMTDYKVLLNTSLDTLASVEDFFSSAFGSIPVLSVIKSSFNLWTAIRKEKYARKIIYMMKSMQLETNDIELKRIKEKINSDSKEFKRAFATTMDILERLIEDEKSAFLGFAFANYVNERIKLNELKNYVIIINELHLEDVSFLKKIYGGNCKDKIEKNELYLINRLINMGLVYETELTDTDLKSYRFLKLTKRGGRFVENALHSFRDFGDVFIGE